jgi:hypothetical protein
MGIWNVGFKITEFGCFEGTVHSALQVLWSLSVKFIGKQIELLQTQEIELPILAREKRHKFQFTRQFHVQFQDIRRRRRRRRRRRTQLSSAMESLIIIFADLRTKSHSINLYLKLKMELGSWDHELLCLLLLLLLLLDDI